MYSVETTAAPAGPAAVIECANDNWLHRWVAAIQQKDPADRSNGYSPGSNGQIQRIDPAGGQVDSGNRAVQRPPLRGSSKRARQGASDPRAGQSGKLPTHWRRAGGRVRERRRWQSRFTDLPIFTGPSPSWGKSRWVAAPRECRGQPEIGLDCGRGANSWPCLSPRLLPLLTKTTANRDKSQR